jgi:hypothetical protein
VFDPAMRRWKLDFPWNKVSTADQKLLQNGRLAMKCQHCETESIAGPWCWKCGRMSDPTKWYKASNVSPDGTRRRGRPSKAQMEARRIADAHT